MNASLEGASEPASAHGSRQKELNRKLKDKACRVVGLYRNPASVGHEVATMSRDRLKVERLVALDELAKVLDELSACPHI